MTAQATEEVKAFSARIGSEQGSPPPAARKELANLKAQASRNLELLAKKTPDKPYKDPNNPWYEQWKLGEMLFSEMAENLTAQMAAIEEAQRKIAELDAEQAKMRQEKAATLKVQAEQNDELQASIAAECAVMRRNAEEIAAVTREIKADSAAIGSTKEDGLGRPPRPGMLEQLAAQKAASKEYSILLAAGLQEAKEMPDKSAVDKAVEATMKHVSDELAAQMVAIEEAQRKVAEYDAVAGNTRQEKPEKEDSNKMTALKAEAAADDREHIKQIGEVFKRAREEADLEHNKQMVDALKRRAREEVYGEKKVMSKERSLKEDSANEQARKQGADK
jgi:hypothetical protein